jgi:hypothetical protein
LASALTLITSLETTQALGHNVPLSLLGRADEVND